MRRFANQVFTPRMDSCFCVSEYITIEKTKVPHRSAVGCGISVEPKPKKAIFQAPVKSGIFRCVNTDSARYIFQNRRRMISGLMPPRRG